MNKILVYGIIFCNLFTFMLFAVDKYRSTHNKWRISEKTLLLSAFIMGGIGAVLGMKVCKHKTKKLKFKILIPLAVITNILIVTTYLYFIVKR